MSKSMTIWTKNNYVFKSMITTAIKMMDLEYLWMSIITTIRAFVYPTSYTKTSFMRIYRIPCRMIMFVFIVTFSRTKNIWSFWTRSIPKWFIAIKTNASHLFSLSFDRIYLLTFMRTVFCGFNTMKYFMCKLLSTNSTFTIYSFFSACFSSTVERTILSCFFTFPINRKLLATC